MTLTKTNIAVPSVDAFMRRKPRRKQVGFKSSEEEDDDEEEEFVFVVEPSLKKSLFDNSNDDEREELLFVVKFVPQVLVAILTTVSSFERI